MHRHWKKFLWSCWYRIWAVAAVSIILLALLFSAARLLFPLVPSYKQEIEQFASNLIQREITIGQVSTDWQWFRPRIKFVDVEVKNNNDALLSVEQVILGINLWTSALNGKIEIDDISVLGSNLKITRDKNGQLFIQNILVYSAQAAGSGQVLAIPPALQNRMIRLLDADIEYADAEYEIQYQLHSVNASVRFAVEAVAAYFDVGLPEELGQRLEFGVELAGKLEQANQLQGRLYLGASNLNLPKIAERLGQAEKVQSGEVTADLWVDIAPQQRYILKGQVAVSEPVFALNENGAGKQWSSDQIRFDLYASADDKEIEGGLYDLSLRATSAEKINDQEQTDISFTFPYTKSERFKRGKLSANSVGLEDLFLLSQLFPEAYKKTSRLGIDSAGGVLKDIYAQWDTVAAQLKAGAVLHEVGVKAKGDIPSISGLSGSIRLIDGVAELDIKTKALVFDYQKLFRQPLPDANIDGVIQLQRDRQSNEYLISARDLHIDTEHAHVRQWFDLRLPQGKSPWVNAFALCAATDASATPRYLPAKKMKPKTLAWLDQAFVSGVAVNGEFELRGPLKKYPFRNGEGVFRIEFDTVGNALSFWPPGPIAKNIRAHARFFGPSLSIFAHELKVLDSTVHDVEFQIDDYRQGVMRVNAYTYGSAKDGLQYIKQSNLRKFFAKVIDQVAIDGQQLSRLSLTIPTKGEVKKPKFVLKGELHKGSLEFKDWGLRFSKINPNFIITESQIVVDKMPGEFNKQPVSVSVVTQTKNEQNFVVSGLHGELDLKAVAKNWQSPVAEYLSGRSTVSAELELALGDKTIKPKLTINSDLRGTTIELPAPFGKGADPQKMLNVRTLFNSDNSDVYFDYADTLSGAVRVDLTSKVKGVSRADIRLNDAVPKMPSTDKIQIKGRLAYFNLDQWLASPLIRRGKGTLLNRLELVEVKVDRFRYLRKNLQKLYLQIGQQDSDWHIKLNSDAVRGRIMLPKQGFGKRGLSINLDYINLDEINEGAADSSPNPSTIPPFQFSARQLILAGWDLRGVGMLAEPSDNKLVVHSMRVSDPAVGMQGSGEWSVNKRGKHRTKLKVRFNSQDIGLGLTRFNFAGILNKGSGAAELDIRWDGAPSQFNFDVLEGNVELAMKDGQVLDIEPGGGRVFGLLSIQTIPRRLALDFSDLFGKGFRFDKMRGNFKFADGNAYTDNYSIDGPAGRIDISGRIGLAQQDYDQQILFRPDLSSSLPLLGVLLGGSTGGWTVVIADRIARLFGKQVDDLAQIRYTLTGSWDDPKVTPVKANSADTGSGDDKQQNNRQAKSE